MRTEFEERSDSISDKRQLTRRLQELSVYDEAGRLKERLTFARGNCAMSRRVIEYDNAWTRSEKVYWGKAVVDRGGLSEGPPPPLTFKTEVQI